VNLKRKFLAILLLIVSTISCSSFVAGQSKFPANGAWEGILKAGKTGLTLYFDITDSAGAIIIPAQRIFRHEMNKIKSSNDSIVFFFEDALLRAQFAGRMGQDSITGVWQQGGAALPLTLHRIPKLKIAHTNVDIFLGYCRQYALHRSAVDWNVIRDSAYLIAGESADIRQLGKAVKYIFGALHDNHATWVYDHLIQVQGPNEGVSRVSSELMSAVMKNGAQLQVVALDKNTGYIRMPMINTTDPAQAAEKAAAIKAAIAGLSAAPLKKWVLDMRLCGGGNMEPMLNGLGDILEDGEMGGFTDNNGRFLKYWGMYNGTFHAGDTVMAIRTNKVRNKLAILTGPVTASAGEAVSIALTGRPDTRSFGTPSFGQITCTNVFPMGSQGMLVISIGYYTDRNKKVYKMNISPGEVVAGKEDFGNPKLDPTVIRAAAWLNK
jgi:carboxyl-terminal processing protease